MALGQLIYKSFIYVAILIMTTQCYILPTLDDFSMKNKMNWSESESYCMSTYNSHLLSIHDSNTVKLVVNEIINIDQQHHNFWIGLSSNYEWSDGSKFNVLIDLLQKINNTHTNMQLQYIVLTYNNNNPDVLWQNSNNMNFWICNDSPIHNTQSIISLSILMIIGSLFCVCCSIFLCSILILKACKYKIQKQKQRNQQNQAKKQKQNHHHRINSASVTTLTKSAKSGMMIDDTTSVDEGIVVKLQQITNHNRRQKSKSSMNLTMDMSTGHLKYMIEFQQENEINQSNIEQKKKRIYRKRKEMIMITKSQKHHGQHHIDLESNEFIIDGLSIEQTKQTKESKHNNYHHACDMNNLQYTDSDGYYFDHQSKEGAFRKQIKLIGFQTDGDDHDSVEEYYEKPHHNDTRTCINYESKMKSKSKVKTDRV